MAKRAINLDGLPTAAPVGVAPPKPGPGPSKWAQRHEREAAEARARRARWEATSAYNMDGTLTLPPQTRADFALQHAECPMNPAECEQFIPRDGRNDYCRWCGGARDDHVLATRLAQEDPPLESIACGTFRPTDSSLGRCRCGFARMQHDPDAVRRWVVSLQGQGRRR